MAAPDPSTPSGGGGGVNSAKDVYGGGDSNTNSSNSNSSSNSSSSSEPVVVCPWSQGLVAVYTLNTSSTTTWFLPYDALTWQRFLHHQELHFPSGVSAVIASWCGRLRDALWLLTSSVTPTTTPSALMNGRGTTVTLEDTRGNTATPEDIHGNTATLEDTHGADATREGTHGTDATREGTHGTDATREGTHGTDATREGTHGTDATREGTHGTDATREGTHGTDATREGTHGTDATREGTHGTIARQTLWKLDHNGKWSALDVVPGKEDIQYRHRSILRRWSDNRGDLFFLQELVPPRDSGTSRTSFTEQEEGGPRSGLRVVKFDTVSGRRTVLPFHHHPARGVWVPGPSGELYSIFTDSRGSWVNTFNYYTGSVVSRDSSPHLPIHIDDNNLLVMIDGTVYNTIPACSSQVLHDAHTEDSVVAGINLYHLILSGQCSQSNTLTATLQDSIAARASTSRHGSLTHDLPNIQAIVGGNRGGGGGNVSSSPLPVGQSPGLSHQADQGGTIFVTDGKQFHLLALVYLTHPAQPNQNPIQPNPTPTQPTPTQPTPPSPTQPNPNPPQPTPIPTNPIPTNPIPNPTQPDLNHTNNSIIFFSLSLSIFALVGIIIFVRRCPLTHELVDGREERGKPPSPLPVLYSIVSDDPAYETSTNNSPCPSYNALYDATVTTTAADTTPSATTPNGGTPNYMTPSSTTPTGLSPSTAARHTITPATFPRDPISYAITNTASDAITIATNNAFTKYLTNSVSDPTNIDSNSTLNTSTSTTQF
ncbi:LWamide neuropeptides-like 3 [Homarus americanus]|uniref:LWamide neuropeptides-like 3 n=1 Tax=Homarus americanus TaxID=6706 RepID=A0A8J5MRX3_HOMAM|nr:LWamide neuropeptides-like 3 [Homarus americanus]